ncbi:MAG: DNA polymerase III subunit delta, partial [bacterium]
EYLNNPSNEVILVLLSYKIDKRKKSLVNILNYGVVCNAKHPDKNEIQLWIRGFAKERSRTIDQQAIEFLATRYEADLSRIEKEMEKTVLYLSEKTEITRKDIEFTATGVSSCSIFDVAPVLAKKDRKQTLQRVQKLLDDGDTPISINSAIMGRIKRLLLGHDILLSKAGDSELAKAVGMPPYYLPEFKLELRNYKREELVRMYKKCMNIDSDLKSAGRNKEDVLVSGVLDLLARRS